MLSVAVLATAFQSAARLLLYSQLRFRREEITALVEDHYSVMRNLSSLDDRV